MEMRIPCPLPSSRQHLSNDDCPEDKREDYQNCPVLYCVQQLCTVIHEQFLKLTAGFVFFTDVKTLFLRYPSWHIIIMAALWNRAGPL